MELNIPQHKPGNFRVNLQSGIQNCTRILCRGAVRTHRDHVGVGDGGRRERAVEFVHPQGIQQYTAEITAVQYVGESQRHLVGGAGVVVVGQLDNGPHRDLPDPLLIPAVHLQIHVQVVRDLFLCPVERNEISMRFFAFGSE